jgi:hypothetical protein
MAFAAVGTAIVTAVAPTATANAVMVLRSRRGRAPFSDRILMGFLL